MEIKENILVVSHLETDIHILSETCKSYGLNAIKASSSMEALNIVMSNPLISLIFIDPNIPTIDNIDTSIKIKEFNEELQIIAIIPRDEYESNKGGTYPFHDFIEKPINPNNIISIIETYIGI